MKHCGTQQLETDKLILRRYVIDDATAMFKNWASDSEVTKFLMWQTHSSEEVSKNIITDWLKQYSDEKYYHWTIVLKDNGDEPLGDIAVVHMNEDVSMMHIGYCIGRNWWHQGITSEALKAVIDFLFDVVDVNRIESRHDPRNPNSGKVMKKCGMKYEGTMRSSDWNNQGICDACYYALLKSEYCLNLSNDNKQTQNTGLKHLWYNGSENEWKKALNHYYDTLRDNQKELECYIENIKADEIKALNVDGFYDFLYDKYFVWKYTMKHRLGSTRKELRRYIENNELTKLESIQNRLFSVQKDNIGECLGIANEIYGLGTAGASGLLSVLFPECFGTLDQFVVKRLREIEHTTYHHKLEKMNPERLNNKDGVILIKIMREKAEELNQKFNTDFWTPRKIDMILWSFGR